jgi:hypothetical protein
MCITKKIISHRKSSVDFKTIETKNLKDDRKRSTGPKAVFSMCQLYSFIPG